MSMIQSKLIQLFSVARSGVYMLESLPLFAVNRYLHPDLKAMSEAQQRLLWARLLELHARDARQIAEGIYPLAALDRESLGHARTYVRILGDGLRMAWRKRRNQTKDFSRAARELMDDLPEYYARNFHWQTDGYLSEGSARIYDHQVEILFQGSAGAMRRQILPILKAHAPADGAFLEVGCGTGSATRGVCATFPRRRVTALDLSSPYLKVAQERLRGYTCVDFALGNGSALPYKDNTFAAVYSVFVLHEVPRKEREAIVREAYRNLRPGGVLIFADSVQVGDLPEEELDLTQFPQVYHEPFYTDYTKDPLVPLLERVTGQTARMDIALVTKVVWVQKPA